MSDYPPEDMDSVDYTTSTPAGLSQKDTGARKEESVWTIKDNLRVVNMEAIFESPSVEDVTKETNLKWGK